MPNDTIEVPEGLFLSGEAHSRKFQNEKLYFQNPVPFSNMKCSEHKFDRFGVIFAQNQKPISHLIDDGVKPNWGTGSQNPE